MDKTYSLGTEKISTLLYRFSVPSIIGMVVNALYNVVDSIFVGQGVGEVGLTAVSIAFPLMLVLMGVGMLVGLGAAALVSIRLGEEDISGAECILGNACSLLCIGVVLTTTVTLLYLDEMLLLLGATPDVMPYARDFTAIILGGSVFMHVGFGLNGIIRAQGDPKTALATMLIAAAINAILNPVFIFVLHLGIKGSAYATVLAQAVAAVWVLVYFIRGTGTLKLRVGYLAVKGQIALGIFRIGLASFLFQLGNSLVMVIFNFNPLHYGGTVAVAAFGIINRVLMLLMMPVIGLSQGAQPIIGYNYGAVEYKRVRKTLKLAMVVATGICMAGFMAIQGFSEEIVRLFNGNHELVAVGSQGLKLFLLMVPVIGFQIIGGNYFQAIGKARQAIVFTVLRQIVLLVPLLYLLPRFWGLTGIWLAGPLSDAVAALVTALALVRETRSLRINAAKVAE